MDYLLQDATILNSKVSKLLDILGLACYSIVGGCYEPPAHPIRRDAADRALSVEISQRQLIDRGHLPVIS